MGNLLVFNLTKLEATSCTEGTQTGTSGIVLGSTWGQGYFKDNFTSFGVMWKFAWRHSIQHQGRKSWGKQLDMQFTGTNQVERLAGVSTNEKYSQAIKQI